MNIISTNPQTACHIFRHKMAPHTESNPLPVSTQLPRDWKNYSLRYIKLNVNDVKIIYKKKFKWGGPEYFTGTGRKSPYYVFIVLFLFLS